LLEPATETCALPYSHFFIFSRPYIPPPTALSPFFRGARSPRQNSRGGITAEAATNRERPPQQRSPQQQSPPPRWTRETGRDDCCT
jgi:hypothetical protein